MRVFVSAVLQGSFLVKLFWRNIPGLFLFPLLMLLALPAFAGQSQPVSNPDVPRCGATATLLHSGEVLVVGGATNLSTNELLDSASLYDPAYNVWYDAASLGTPRSRHSALLLPSGKVLIMAGSSLSGYTLWPLLYDPATNTWTGSASYPFSDSAYSFATLTLLNNGNVLAVGNYPTARLYEPASDSWSEAGTPAVIRYKHTATLLPDGKVLITGGQRDDTGEALAASELYDPVNNSWSSVASMVNPRRPHRDTPAHWQGPDPGGKILLFRKRHRLCGGIV